MRLELADREEQQAGSGRVVVVVGNRTDSARGHQASERALRTIVVDSIKVIPRRNRNPRLRGGESAGRLVVRRRLRTSN